MEGENNLEILINKPTPQDVIATVLAYAGLATFTNDQEKIQRFILSMKSDGGEAADLLKSFTFSDGVDIYPYSRLLASVLSSLLLGGVIFTWSPQYDSYNIGNEIREKIIKQAEERFSSEQVPVLKRLGREWREFNMRQA